MSESKDARAGANRTRGPLPEAEQLPPHRRPFHLVWLIPLVAAIIAGYLVWQTYANRGASIVVTFRSGDGLVAGQTKVRHKAVELGTVRSVGLSKDFNRVEVGIDMQRQAQPMLTENARFWVVRPRLTGSNISGLETLVSGAYIEIDPGTGPGEARTAFNGLEDPPAVRSGEPGTAYELAADRIGSLGSGSPVFWRDIVVGEVLNYDTPVPGSGEAVKIHLFIRKPFDDYVHPDTHFWNASGVSVDLGADGIQLRLESLQAALSGGIAFETPPGARREPREARKEPYRLYRNESEAQAAGYATRVKMIVYFDGSVRGLSNGAPVMLNGIQIGNVTDIKLRFDPRGAGPSSVAVHVEVQPERFTSPEKLHQPANDLEIARALVANGLRAQLTTANFLTGQKLVEFIFQSDASPVEAPRIEGDEIVMPGVSGGLDGLTSNLGRIAEKLEHLPLDQLARNLDDALHGLSTLINGPDLKQTMQGLAATSKRLPGVAQSLEATASGAEKLVASAQAGYGPDSQVRRDLSRTLDQVSAAARSLRLLADYLSVHPEALIRGRSDRGDER